MNVSITARKFKARDTLKSYINDELSSLTRFYDDILRADVILSYRKPNNSVKSAEITLHVPGQTLVAADESDDFKKSVNSSVDKLETQLRKLKSKRTMHRNA